MNLIRKTIFSQKIQDFTINFDRTGLSDKVRLTVKQVDLGAITNAVITEVIIMSKNFKYILIETA